MHSVDQPAAESNDKADALAICQPLGLGPATNWTFWVAVVPKGRRCGDVGAGHAALLVDVGDVEGQRELALRGRLVVRPVGGDALDPADAALNVGRLAGERAAPGEGLQRLQERSL